MLQWVTSFKALGDPVRLRLFALLGQRDEVCVCHLVEALHLPQSTISRHLAVLRHAGLVSTRRDGKWMYYACSGALALQLQTLLSHDAQAELQHDLASLQNLSCD